MKHLLLFSILLFLGACQTPNLEGLSKDERRFVLQNAEARRQAWRAVGIGLVNFGLQSAANSLNNESGFRK